MTTRRGEQIDIWTCEEATHLISRVKNKEQSRNKGKPHPESISLTVNQMRRRSVSPPDERPPSPPVSLSVCVCDVYVSASVPAQGCCSETLTHLFSFMVVCSVYPTARLLPSPALTPPLLSWRRPMCSAFRRQNYRASRVLPRSPLAIGRSEKQHPEMKAGRRARETRLLGGGEQSLTHTHAQAHAQAHTP